MGVEAPMGWILGVDFNGCVFLGIIIFWTRVSLLSGDNFVCGHSKVFFLCFSGEIKIFTSKHLISSWDHFLDHITLMPLFVNLLGRWISDRALRILFD